MAEVAGLELRFPHLGRFDVPRVDQAILGRVQDMYSGKEGSTPKDSGGNQQLERTLGGIYSGSVLGAIPGIGPALQSLAAGATALQTNSGLRSDRIKQLAQQEVSNSTYNPSTNNYGSLGFLDRVIDIRPDAVTSQIASDRRRDLLNSDAVQAIQQDLGEKDFNKLFPKGSATGNLEIQSVATELNTRAGLLKDIEENLGTERLAAARAAVKGRRLTNDELRVIKDESFKETPKERRAQADSDSLSDLRRQQGQAAVTEAAASQTAAGAQVTSANASALTAETGRISAINADRIAKAKLAFELDKIKYDRDVAMYGIDAKAREAGLDRDLRKDLAVLGLEDKRADRRYDRERDERKDRQMMIMQLLGGLKNLGSAFAL